MQCWVLKNNTKRDVETQEKGKSVTIFLALIGVRSATFSQRFSLHQRCHRHSERSMQLFTALNLVAPFNGKKNPRLSTNRKQQVPTIRNINYYYKLYFRYRVPRNIRKIKKEYTKTHYNQTHISKSIPTELRWSTIQLKVSLQQFNHCISNL